MKRVLITIVLLLFYLALSLPAYARKVTNVRTYQEGKTVVITYDLDEDAMIDLTIIYGNGSTLGIYKNNKSGSNAKGISGDVGYVKQGKGKRIVWDVLQDSENFICENTRFKVDANSVYSETKTFVIGEYGFGFTPQHSFGLTIGQIYKFAGWYASIRTNLSAKKDNGLTCLEGGYVDNYLPFYSGTTKNNHFVMNVGGLWNLLGTFSHSEVIERSMVALYIGVGYGQRYQLWETLDRQWVTYGPTAYKGFSGEFGVIADLKGFTLMAGLNTINFKYVELEAGIGWTISHKNR